MHDDRPTLVRHSSPLRPRRSVPANAGIRLLHHGDHWAVVPNPPPMPPTGMTITETFPLPKLAWPKVDWACGWLRHVWTDSQRCCCWLLYLHTQSHAWRLHLPPQTSLSGGDVLIDVTGWPYHVPGPQYRLAGTIRSSRLSDADAVRDLLPPLDGVHLVMNPQLDGVHLQCYVHAEETLSHIPAASIIHYAEERYARHAYQQRLLSQ